MVWGFHLMAFAILVLLTIGAQFLEPESPIPSIWFTEYGGVIGIVSVIGFAAMWWQKGKIKRG